jgi:hypothetical protein
MVTQIPQHKSDCEDKGRCVSCGFLEVEVGVPFMGRIVAIGPGKEVGRHTRETGSPTWPASGDRYNCILGAAPIQAEAYQERGRGTTGQESILRVFEKHRDCSSWYPYKPNYTPKEHLEMLRNEEIENRRTEFQLRLAEMDRQTQETHTEIMRNQTQLLADSKQVADDVRIITENTIQRNDKITVWIIVLAALQIVVPLLVELFKWVLWAPHPNP